MNSKHSELKKSRDFGDFYTCNLNTSLRKVHEINESPFHEEKRYSAENFAGDSGKHILQDCVISREKNTFEVLSDSNFDYP